MSNMPDFDSSCPETGPGFDDAIVPINPFYALRYPFGMLLGVEDFEAAQAYPRGKIRLHNAWLHGEGVVWGFGVTAPVVAPKSAVLRGEIQVDPGLALDALGHELHLDEAACVSVAAWYEQHKKDAALGAVIEQDGSVQLDAHIELRFRACLTRQVPAMNEPCDTTSNGVAYSRAFETVEIKLVPGKAPVGAYPYHLLRMLFGLEAPVDAANPTPSETAVQKTLVDLAAETDELRPAKFLAAFRTFAALDGIALRPGQTADGARVLLFPGGEDAPVTIAQLHLTLRPTAGGVLQLATADIDTSVRRAHVATSTIQELNLLSPFPAAPTDAGGPRIVRASLPTAVPLGTTIEFTTTKPLDPLTVQAAAFTVTSLRADDGSSGWKTIGITGATVNGDRVTLTLAEAPGGRQVRLVARGTGASPLLDVSTPPGSGLPLAGATDDPRPGSLFDGIDFVHMWKGTE